MADNRNGLFQFIQDERRFFVNKHLLQIPAICDKIFFIRQIFNNNFKKILITIPPHYDQICNVEMLKKFVEIPINGNRENYELFKNKTIIFQDQEFFEKNFATYPLVYLNLKYTYPNNDFYTLVDGFRLCLHESFKKHPYLLESNKLDAEEINQFKKYYNENLYEILNKTEIIEGLVFLAKCLSKHFDDKKVFLLIENYDRPLDDIIFDYNSMHNFYHIYHLLSKILTTILNSEHVERAVMTGVHNLDIFGPPVNDNIGRYLFLHDHQFTKYFTLTESEIDKVLTHMEMSDKKKQNFIDNLDGFVTIKGIKLFPTESIVCLLNRTMLFDSISFRDPLILYRHIPIIRYLLTKVCLEQPFTIEILQKLEVKHILELRKLLIEPEMIQSFQTFDLFLSYMLHRGGFTYFNKVVNDNFCQVVLVNNLLKNIYKRDLNVYHHAEYVSKFAYNCRLIEEGLPRIITNSYLEKCAVSLDKISPNCDENIFKELVIVLNECLKNLIFNQDVFHNLMFDILCNTSFLIGKNRLSFTNGKPDLIFYKDDLAIIVQTEYKRSPELALKRLIEVYVNIFKDKVCLNDKKEKVYLGLNINEYKLIKMSVLVNNTDLSKAKTY